MLAFPILTCINEIRKNYKENNKDESLRLKLKKKKSQNQIQGFRFESSLSNSVSTSHFIEASGSWNKLWYTQSLTYKVPWNCFVMSVQTMKEFQSGGEEANLTLRILQCITTCFWFRVFITTFHLSKHCWLEPKPNYQTTCSMSAFMLNSHHSLFKDKSNAMGFTSSLFLHKNSKFQLPCSTTRCYLFGKASL